MSAKRYYVSIDDIDQSDRNESDMWSKHTALEYALLNGCKVELWDSSGHKVYEADAAGKVWDIND